MFNNCVADFCTAWLRQPGLFNIIIDKIADNFIENINIANVEISKLATLREAVSIILLLHSDFSALDPWEQYKELKFNSPNIKA